MDVQVLHVKSGAPAGALQAKDLRVFEEGARQEVSQFSRDEYPLSVVMLFDLTESVRGVLKHLAEGAKSAMAHFKPEDEVAVMVYSGGATLVDDFTRDRSRTLQGIGKASVMRSDQPAHFNEAVYQAAMQLRKSGNASNRRVIVWLTDNYPNVPFRQMPFPLHTEIEALRALHEEGVVVAPILMKSALGALIMPFANASEASKRKYFPPGDAKKYAGLTGGLALGMRGKQPEERLAQLIDELRARYTSDTRRRVAGGGNVSQDPRGTGSGRGAASEGVDGAGARRILPEIRVSCQSASARCDRSRLRAASAFAFRV